MKVARRCEGGGGEEVEGRKHAKERRGEGGAVNVGEQVDQNSKRG